MSIARRTGVRDANQQAVLSTFVGRIGAHRIGSRRRRPDAQRRDSQERRADDDGDEQELTQPAQTHHGDLPRRERIYDAIERRASRRSSNDPAEESSEKPPRLLR